MVEDGFDLVGHIRRAQEDASAERRQWRRAERAHRMSIEACATLELCADYASPVRGPFPIDVFGPESDALLLERGGQNPEWVSVNEEFCSRWLCLWTFSARPVLEHLGFERVRDLPPESAAAAITKHFYLRLLRYDLADDPIDSLTSEVSDARSLLGAARFEMHGFFRQLRSICRRLPSARQLARENSRRSEPSAESDSSHSKPSSSGAKFDAEIIKEGDGWRVVFADLSAFVAEHAGFVYIRKLLDAPGKRIHVTELYSKLGLPKLGSDLVVDRTARNGYIKEAEKLREELEEAKLLGHMAKYEEVFSDLQRLEKVLSQCDTPLTWKKRLGDDAERIRAMVGKDIKRSMDAIRKGHPRLGVHLKESVRTPSGLNPSYAPDPVVRWLIQPSP